MHRSSAHRSMHSAMRTGAMHRSLTSQSRMRNRTIMGGKLHGTTATGHRTMASRHGSGSGMHSSMSGLHHSMSGSRPSMISRMMKMMRSLLGR